MRITKLITHVAASAAMLALVAVGCGGDIIGSGNGGVTGQNGGSGNNNGGGGGGSATPPSSYNNYAPDDPVCPSSKAPALFNNALCVCNDLADIGVIVVRRGAFDKVAPFAVNGHAGLAAHCEVEGSLIAKRGMHAAANVEVGGSFYSEADVHWAGRMAVTHDLDTSGSLHGIGFLDVGGALRVAGAADVLGIKKVASEGPFTPRAGDPCNCNGVNVAGEVAKARTDNVNAQHGLSTDARHVLGVDKVTLTSGKYYFGGAATIGLSKLTIDGIVAIYIDGNLEAIGVEKIQLTPGSSLDLYVSGNVRTIGHTVLGAGGDPSAFRLFIGGSGPLNLSVGNQVFNGTIYAPHATLHYVGRTVVKGAVLAGSLNSVGLFEVHYARPTLVPPNKCGKPSKPAPASPPPPAPQNPDHDLPRVM